MFLVRNGASSSVYASNLKILHLVDKAGPFHILFGLIKFLIFIRGMNQPWWLGVVSVRLETERSWVLNLSESLQ